MAALQSPGPNPPASASRSFGRSMLWAIASIGLGVIVILNSSGSSADSVPQVLPVVAAPPTYGPVAPPVAELVLPRSAPKRLSIPQIGVNAPFTTLAIGKSGRLDAPPANNSNLVGWFAGGVSPGERGAAIVAGHVDTKTGPAVFVQLRLLKPGGKVAITREDGTVASFVVDSVESFSKARFPNERVYADTPNPQLRLITCGGSYDRKKKDYTENVVVFAHLDSA
ncbi:class F sortase [Streptomyces sp. NBC_00879]|uniref:class F sortase n=1 Tax=Streptomyces sp. NBC_00879 TaxID=2975855 RepID=UPI003868B9C5|nr:class F sortase [Streptomyces sp. NBC_00879]